MPVKIHALNFQRVRVRVFGFFCEYKRNCGSVPLKTNSLWIFRENKTKRLLYVTLKIVNESKNIVHLFNTGKNWIRNEKQLANDADR